jgi:hypothetical protein
MPPPKIRLGPGDVVTKTTSAITIWGLSDSVTCRLTWSRHPSNWRAECRIYKHNTRAVGGTRIGVLPKVGVNAELIPYSRGTQIFVTSRSHHKILDRSVMYNKFHTEDSQAVGATVLNVVATVIRRQEFAHPCRKVSYGNLKTLTIYSLAVSLRTTRFNIQKFYMVLALPYTSNWLVSITLWKVFTARYGLIPYIKQITVRLKPLGET